MNRKVFMVGNELRVTPIELRLLSILIRHDSLVFKYQQLLKKVWGSEHSSIIITC